MLFRKNYVLIELDQILDSRRRMDAFLQLYYVDEIVFHQLSGYVRILVLFLPSALRPEPVEQASTAFLAGGVMMMKVDSLLVLRQFSNRLALRYTR